jgi:hypothetical protein
MINELLITGRVEIKRYPKERGADMHQNMVRVGKSSPEGWMLQLRGKTSMATVDYLSADAARALIAKLEVIIAAIEPKPETPPRFNMFARADRKEPWFWPLPDEDEERGSEG